MKPFLEQLSTTSHRLPTYYTFYHTGYGRGIVIFTDRGITNLIFPSSCERTVKQTLLNRFPHAVFEKDGYSRLKSALSSYFQGKNVKFNFSLDLTGNSLFQKNVFSIARKIPYGERRSYCWIASKLKKPGTYRAVGNALGKNPVPIIIPCHRVIREDGSLGGFSAGVEWKKRLLEIESRGV